MGQEEYQEQGKTARYVMILCIFEGLMLEAKKTVSVQCCSHLIPLMGSVSNSLRECWVGPSRVKSKLLSLLGHRERLLCCCSRVAANDIRKAIKLIYFQDRVVSILGTGHIHFPLTNANWSWAGPSLLVLLGHGRLREMSVFRLHVVGFIQLRRAQTGLSLYLWNGGQFNLITFRMP